jgi:hypothetical protein
MGFGKSSASSNTQPAVCRRGRSIAQQRMNYLISWGSSAGLIGEAKGGKLTCSIPIISKTMKALCSEISHFKTRISAVVGDIVDRGVVDVY